MREELSTLTGTTISGTTISGTTISGPSEPESKHIEGVLHTQEQEPHQQSLVSYPKTFVLISFLDEFMWS